MRRIPVHRVAFHFFVPLLPSFASRQNEFWDALPLQRHRFVRIFFFAGVGERCEGRIWRSVILLVLCGCESWSRTWNIEHWLRVKIALFWDARPCDLVARCHRFGWALYLHLQDGRGTLRSHYIASHSKLFSPALWFVWQLLLRWSNQGGCNVCS
jgi:hypothetical protein